MIQPVIICGGTGVRLWPLSRKSYPKQFLKIFNEETLFEKTLKRINKLKRCRLPIIVASKNHEFEVKHSLDKMKIRAKVFLEPVGKNTTAAIYIAAKNSKKSDTLLVLPSDHLINNDEELIRATEYLDTLKLFNNWFVFGVVPITPSPEYGYIKLNQNQKKNLSLLNKKKFNVEQVLSFTEKPSKNIALKMFNSKNYLWNSGIFVSNASFVISSISNHSSEISKSCDKAISSQFSSYNLDFINFDENTFNKIPSQSIDYAVIEKENDIKCIQLNIQWEDIGSWDNLLKIIKYNNVKNNNLVEVDGQNDVFTSKDRMVATIGIKDLMIIDTKDATLISKKNRSEDLRKIVDLIEIKNKIFLNNRFSEKRPWGYFDVLLDSEACKVKKLYILPFKKLSLQYHKHRNEHWFIVSGIATIHLDGKNFDAEVGNSIDVKKGKIHSIGNSQKNELIIIEIQTGKYFGEDDIVRLEDLYDRG